MEVESADVRVTGPKVIGASCARQCAHQSAQTRSEDHHSAANANQVPNKERA